MQTFHNSISFNLKDGHDENADCVVTALHARSYSILCDFQNNSAVSSYKEGFRMYYSKGS